MVGARGVRAKQNTLQTIFFPGWWVKHKIIIKTVHKIRPPKNRREMSSSTISDRLLEVAPWLRPFSTSQPEMQTMSRSTASGRCSSTTSSWTSSSSSTLMASRMRMGGTALLWRVSRLRNSASSSSLPFSKRAFLKEIRKTFFQVEHCKAATLLQFKSEESLATAPSCSSREVKQLKTPINILSVILKTRRHQLQNAFHSSPEGYC